MTRKNEITPHIGDMDRRTFTQSLAALCAVPAVPLTAAAAPVATVASVPSQARFWAIYMSGLHGTCTPRALEVMLNIPSAQAKGYLSQLMAQGVIKPSGLTTGLEAHRVATNRSKLVERVKEKVFDSKEDLDVSVIDAPSDDDAVLDEGHDDVVDAESMEDPSDTTIAT